MFWIFWLGGMWDLSPYTRDPTHTQCIGKQSLNHWTEVPALRSLYDPEQLIIARQMISDRWIFFFFGKDKRMLIVK